MVDKLNCMVVIAEYGVDEDHTFGNNGNGGRGGVSSTASTTNGGKVGSLNLHNSDKIMRYS